IQVFKNILTTKGHLSVNTTERKKKAHESRLKVSICGELAARRDYASRFLDTGVDCISIAPSKILLMRDHIINCCW
ncbi:MAG: hypothetical protein J6U50_08850, partial [Lachnospiraceae bacterium]|nr:hypothetical protein [Lachnospiraceae bacterium]